MKEYLEKREKGELVVQKVDLLKQNILQPVTWVSAHLKHILKH